MAFSIDNFVANLRGGGARPSLFQVSITNPINGAADAQVPFMCKGSSIPGSTVSIIEIPYGGRIVKQPGTRTFEDWTTTIYNDEDFAIRNALEQWSDAINAHENGEAAAPGVQPKGTATVTQYGKSGEILRVYELYGIFPSEVGPIELSWEDGDAIEEYETTFAYDYWKVVGGTTGTVG